ncbi:calpain family cysteine protease [Kordia sp. SMS9]|uniref:C2 family cysteine protease n=1 Tax=Kordia sp. SMS9 TaxID=2282170 RepID=UPI000E0DF0EE|nr:C2 family cysteine protease [Kordia sp. SMS9]AXG69986.1 calpain family cysteine protease [Kordia sp. SMS9]
MKPVLIFDTTKQVKKYCDINSNYIHIIDTDNLEETESKVFEWYDSSQNYVTCDNELLLAIINRENLEDNEITIIEDIIGSYLRSKECKILLFSFFKNEVKESSTVKINNQVTDTFLLGNEDESGGLYNENNDKDKFHITQIFLEYLLENYSNYSQIKQNSPLKEFENTFHSLGAIKYYLSKEVLQKNAVKIIEAQNFSKFIFKENFGVNESILDILNDNTLAHEVLEDIQDNNHISINKHSNPPELKIRANKFITENNILNKDEELIITVHSEKPNFEEYCLNNESYSEIKLGLDNLRQKAKHQDDIEVRSNLEANAHNTRIAIQKITGEYKRNKLLETERDFNNDFNTRVDIFKENTQALINTTILNFKNEKKYRTTNLENAIATLDFIKEGKSEYAEKTSNNDSQNLEKILATHFDKAISQFETQKTIFNNLKTVENTCNHLENVLKKNDDNIFNSSRDVLLLENHFKLGKLPDVNKYSYLKLSFLPITNITFLLILNILVIGLCLLFIGKHYLYWSAPLVLINIALILSSIKELKTKRVILENHFYERERIISNVKSTINDSFSTICDSIKYTYKNRLLKRFITIIQEERYNILQMRKYFIYHYYNTILSIQKDIDFKSNHIINVIDSNFVKSLILNVTPSSYFNDQKLVEYLEEFKKHNNDVSYKFEEPDYRDDLLTIDYNTNEKICMTIEHQNNDIEYLYDSVPNATLFNRKGNTKSINSNDIHQGEVGDCYFLAVLAGIADTMPSLIKNSIIYNKEENFYSLRFYDNDKNEVYVNIDDKLYSRDGKTDLIYAKFNQSQKDILKTWVALFEKAWAKLNGGYENIIGSSSERNVTDFGLAITGSYMQAKSLRDFNSEENLQEFLTKVRFSDKKTIITLGSLEEQTDDSNTNIVTQHAYTLQKTTKSSYTLYNPHGQNHFNDINFNFLKSNFDYLYYFTLNNSTPIRPSKKLSINKKIRLFDSDLVNIFENSDLNKRIKNLNFFDLFWSNDNSNQKKTQEIYKKSKSLISQSIINDYKKNKDIFHILMNESKAEETKEKIEKELKHTFGMNLKFTDTTNDIFSLIKIKLIIN